VSGLRAEAETQRLRAEDAQRQVDLTQKRLTALSAEKDSLAERVVALEKSASARPVAAKAEKVKPTKVAAAPPARPKATPVASKPSAAKHTP
jgi:hypothetical protein